MKDPQGNLMLGRTRWWRFGAVMIPALAVVGGLLFGISAGAFQGLRRPARNHPGGRTVGPPASKLGQFNATSTTISSAPGVPATVRVTPDQVPSGRARAGSVAWPMAVLPSEG